jgi:MFS family permease
MSGSAESYFSAFALFLKASTTQIGVLASLPPLIASFAQLASAWVGRRIGRRRPLIVAGALLQASMLVPLVLLPLLLPERAPEALIACGVVYFIGPNFGAPQWSSLIGDLVPETYRGRFFALRTRLSSSAGFIALVGAGLTLHFFDVGGATYWGFVAIFSFAALARCVSAYHLSRMLDPPGHVASLETPFQTGLWTRIRSSPLVLFSAYFAFTQLAVAISGPFVAVHLLRDLEFTYLQFMLNSGASVLVQFLTLNRWGHISDVFGNRPILVTTGFAIPFIPALWLVSADFYYLLVVQAMSGLIWAGFSLSATNFVFDLTPPHKRVTYMAAHNIVASTAIFVGALLGGILAATLPRQWNLGITIPWAYPLYGIFLISTVARLMVALVFVPKLKEVRTVRPTTIGRVIFRVTRFHPISSLYYDAIVRTRRAKRQQGRRDESELGS